VKITDSIDIETYFKFIDPDYIRELSSISPHVELQTDFKVAYLILFFQISQKMELEKGILLGDLFISILTGRLISRDRQLLSRIIQGISSYHSEKISGRRECYKRKLLLMMREVTHADRYI